MRVLVIGGGGREHALVWKIAQSKRVAKIFCAPGNAGIGELAECVPIAATNINKLVAFASEKEVDLTIVGPEGPLCAGIVDAFQAKGLKIFGPNRRAAQLEGSKAFCKRFLLQHGIPTAEAGIFDNPVAARDYVRQRGAPIVVKADGLAAGKGVVVAQTVEEAERAIDDIMVQRAFGEAGKLVVIEECLTGEETSVMALMDGKTFKLLPAAQDHKRVGDGDTGPNTGGMGAYSPTLRTVDATEAESDETRFSAIFERTVAGMKEYRGVLYAGLMMTEAGPKVLEFNCRFGDPETQAVLPRMDFDLIDAAEAVINGGLDRLRLKWRRDAAVCVVMAAGGYPGHYDRGKPIEGLKEAAQLDKVCVFHAGTRREANGQIVTDGGRVLGVTGFGADTAQAAQSAYEAVERIHFDGAQFRRDIAARAMRKKI